MKHITLVFITMILALSLSAQEAKIIQLPDANKTGGMPLMEALNNRASQREFSENPLSLQQLSDLLWATWGINRENGKHTAPSSRNKQEMDVYISTKDGLFLYLPEKHQLQQILDKDIRKITGEQNFVEKAAVNLIFVADYKRIQSTSEKYKNTSGVNTGFMAQNVYLFCASENLACVVRGWFDHNKLHKAMRLAKHQEIILCQTVGYKAE